MLPLYMAQWTGTVMKTRIVHPHLAWMSKSQFVRRASWLHELSLSSSAVNSCFRFDQRNFVHCFYVHLSTRSNLRNWHTFAQCDICVWHPLKVQHTNPTRKPMLCLWSINKGIFDMRRKILIVHRLCKLFNILEATPCRLNRRDSQNWVTPANPLSKQLYNVPLSMSQKTPENPSIVNVEWVINYSRKEFTCYMSFRNYLSFSQLWHTLLE